MPFWVFQAMKISDPENLIPNHEHLIEIVSSHPFDDSLADKITKITVRSLEPIQFLERICIDINTGHVDLLVSESTHSKPNYDSILYHEFGHVADILNTEFGFSKSLNSVLSNIEQSCVAVLWDVYINTRLNANGFYTPCGCVVHGTLNGDLKEFSGTLEGELEVKMTTLEKAGFSNKRAKEFIFRIWKNPDIPWTYPKMIQAVREGEK